MATLKKTENCFFKTNYHLMQVKSTAECSKGSILQYFPFDLHLATNCYLDLFCLFFEWPFYTGFTVNFLAGAGIPVYIYNKAKTLSL